MCYRADWRQHSNLGKSTVQKECIIWPTVEKGKNEKQCATISAKIVQAISMRFPPNNKVTQRICDETLNTATWFISLHQYYEIE